MRCTEQQFRDFLGNKTELCIVGCWNVDTHVDGLSLIERIKTFPLHRRRAEESSQVDVDDDYDESSVGYVK